MKKSKIKLAFKFKNLLIKKGKLAFANSVVLSVLFFLKRKFKKNPINLMNNSLKNITPVITTKKYVVAGRLYNLPTPITKNKALYFCCKWLQQAALENKENKQKDFDVKIYEEFLKVLSKKGQSFVFLKNHNKLVSENRPYLRFIRKKFKPRLPRKVWLKRRRILWLSRKRKFKPRSSTIFGHSFSLKGYDSFLTYTNRKYASRQQRVSSSYFRLYNRVRVIRVRNRALLRIKKERKIRLKLKLIKRKLFLKNKLSKKDKLNKKPVFKSKSKVKNVKKKNENKTIIKKNKF